MAVSGVTPVVPLPGERASQGAELVAVQVALWPPVVITGPVNCSAAGVVVASNCRLIDVDGIYANADATYQLIGKATWPPVAPALNITSAL